MEKLMLIFLIFLVITIVKSDDQCTIVENISGFKDCKNKDTGNPNEPHCCYEEATKGGIYCDSYSDDEMEDLENYAENVYNKNPEVPGDKITYIKCGVDIEYGISSKNKCELKTEAKGLEECKNLESNDEDYPYCCYEESTADGKYCASFSEDLKNDLNTYAVDYNLKHPDDRVTYTNCGGNYTIGAKDQCRIVENPEGFLSCKGLETGDSENPNCCYEESTKDGANCKFYSDDKKNHLETYVDGYNSVEEDQITYVKCGDEEEYGINSKNQCDKKTEATGLEDCQSLATNDAEYPYCCYEESTKDGKYCASFDDTLKNDLLKYVNNYNSEHTDDKVTLVNCGNHRTFGMLNGNKYLDINLFIIISICLLFFSY